MKSSHIQHFMGSKYALLSLRSQVLREMLTFSFYSKKSKTDLTFSNSCNDSMTQQQFYFSPILKHSTQQTIPALPEQLEKLLSIHHFFSQSMEASIQIVMSRRKDNSLIKKLRKILSISKQLEMCVATCQ